MRDDDGPTDPAIGDDELARAAWTMLDKLAVFLIHKQVLTLSELASVANAAADDMRASCGPIVPCLGADFLQSRYDIAG